MQRTLLWRSLLAACIACAVIGCSKTKEEAMAEVAKIDAACKAGEGDKARTLMQEAAAKNQAFQSAYEASTSGVSDKSRINACGLVLTEIKKRLEHGS